MISGKMNALPVCLSLSLPLFVSLCLCLYLCLSLFDFKINLIHPTDKDLGKTWEYGKNTDGILAGRMNALTCRWQAYDRRILDVIIIILYPLVH